MLLQLRSSLLKDQSLIDRVFVLFVFNGDPNEADRSPVLDRLREDLENKKHLIDQFFGRPVDLLCEFRSARTHRVGGTTRHRITHQYPVELSQMIHRPGPNGQQMHIGFIRLVDLHAMYREMGHRFFERNIRAGLGDDEAPNRAVFRALKAIVIEGRDSPSVFAFNHNGVTLYAEKFEPRDGDYVITEPRLLNGAQTLTTFDRFVKKNEGNLRLASPESGLPELSVLCKIITEAKPDFFVTVTVNNNRQNPVLPWNLRANDLIQLQLQEKFQQELGIYYERQENAFSNLTQEDLDELEILENKAVQLLKLAYTYLAADGAIDRMTRMRDVFEDDKSYEQVFSPSRLRADLRKVVLCYKVQFRLNRIVQEIRSKGQKKYAYMRRARNLLWALLCQAMLNDERLEVYAERFGKGLSIEADYTDWLGDLASTRARFLISGVTEREDYALMLQEERYDFLKSKAVYERCMELAYKKWRWTQQRLK